MKKSYIKKHIAYIIAFLFVSSCGFQPLYVEKTTTEKWYFGNEFDVSISQEMEKISVQVSDERFGQEIRNNLLDILSPKGSPSEPKYKLYVTLDNTEVVRQALRRDITATRERVRYFVVYKMTQDGEELFSNNSVAYVSYDILANPYSTTMAQKDSESNAAKIISDDIALRVGAYFHQEMGKK